ncbi:MAG: MarR family transcriptional regulator [Chloroflexi bacterium]|nr:MarR family transcriptional regulator [Chloroflexota bacterium]
MDQQAEGNPQLHTRTPQFDLESWVAGLAHAIAADIERQTARHGLTVSEFTLLRAFIEKQERTFSQLAEALPIEREGLAHMVGTLVDRGLLQRRASDPRAMLLSLTRRGRYLAWRLHTRMQTEHSGLLEGVSDEELATLSAVVARIVENHTALEQSRLP